MQLQRELFVSIQLEDEKAIRELLSAYCYCVDRGEFTTFSTESISGLYGRKTISFKPISNPPLSHSTKTRHQLEIHVPLLSIPSPYLPHTQLITSFKTYSTRN